MAFQSVAQMLNSAEHQSLWRAVLADDCRDRCCDEADSLGKMSRLWQAMKDSVAGYDPHRRSPSGLSGGQARKMEQAANPLCGEFLQQVMATALRVGEHNACMGRIVAAPTAGASGVLPAVLIPLQEKERLGDEAMVACLYVAAGFGQVIAARASISGAEGGCQAEIGSASAMAAAALVHARGGSAAQMAAACAMALQNVLGLVCDPVAGLVEAPCVKRNVMGAVNAMACADMALAGIEPAIPCDEVIDAMAAVGRTLPPSLRETGEGGLAATPTARKIAEQVLG
ncbi:MAG: L-serine ammonia-lyase, iron-sulfur-dependent, subunit alpha [Oscillospiraceae bacterium]|nr:L-serine ammonia-lyase, iron-sulfur-dependent, subunit alpha [Oscillospiraceae bacterium]